MRQTTPQHGFTLVEMVMVIVIMGVIGSIVSVFMKAPIDAYFDSARRAALTDVADTTVRRMARDIRKALPNSVRQSISPAAANTQCIEFIPTKTGRRYRAAVNGVGAGNILDFTTPKGSFDMLGSNSVLPDQAIGVGDLIAVYNLGITGADAYATDNTSPVIAPGVVAGSLANETKINITPKQFPFASGGSRFHVIPSTEKIVSYVCSGGNLNRYANYPYTSSCTSTGATSVTVLASNVSYCSFIYNGSDLQRNALVQLTIKFTDSVSTETVSLYHEVHVDNTP